MTNANHVISGEEEKTAGQSKKSTKDQTTLYSLNNRLHLAQAHGEKTNIIRLLTCRCVFRRLVRKSYRPRNSTTETCTHIVPWTFPVSVKKQQTAMVSIHDAIYRQEIPSDPRTFLVLKPLPQHMMSHPSVPCDFGLHFRFCVPAKLIQKKHG